MGARTIMARQARRRGRTAVSTGIRSIPNRARGYTAAPSCPESEAMRLISLKHPLFLAPVAAPAAFAAAVDDCADSGGAVRSITGSPAKKP